jgi:hypothetical protein
MTIQETTKEDIHEIKWAYYSLLLHPPRWSTIDKDEFKQHPAIVMEMIL